MTIAASYSTAGHATVTYNFNFLTSAVSVAVLLRIVEWGAPH